MGTTTPGENDHLTVARKHEQRIKDAKRETWETIKAQSPEIAGFILEAKAKFGEIRLLCYYSQAQEQGRKTTGQEE